MAPASEEILVTSVSSPATVFHTHRAASRSPEPAASLSSPKQKENEILALLQDLDTLQKQYDEGLHEVHAVRTLLFLERKKREVVEKTCLDLEREKQQLLKGQLATYERASKQLDYASKYDNALQLVKAVQEKSDLNNKVLCQHLTDVHRRDHYTQDSDIDVLALDTAKLSFQEHEKTITVLRTQHEAKVEELHKQITVLKQDIVSKECSVTALEEKLAQSVTPDKLEEKLREAEKRVNDSYQNEVEGLRKKLKAEEIMNQNLQSQLQDAQHTLMVSNVNHDDQLRELSANRQADIFKHKVLKLRKDNEVRRQQLQQHLK